MYYTVGELIEELNKFPKDLEILTELSMMWNFPKEIKPKIDELGYDDYVELTQKEAYELLIFEGSWEKNNKVLSLTAVKKTNKHSVSGNLLQQP